MISTSIKLDGEQEFKKQISNINGNLKTLDEEMKYVTEKFKDQADSVKTLEEKDRILNDQVEKQEEKVRLLREQLEKANEAFADAPEKIDKYKQNLYRAETQLEKTRKEQKKVNDLLNDARSAANNAGDSLDNFGDDANSANEKTEPFAKTVSGLIGNLGKIKGAIVGGAAVGAIKELGEGILGVEEDTREFRTITGTLEASSQQLGYSAEETAELFEKLYGVLGDEQTAATAAANLQALNLEQEDLMKLTDLAVGAWGRYGDSIPIDGLAESINETIKASDVTGVFADVLNWAGDVTEEEFNTALANAKDITERTDLVMQLMAEQGLADAAQGFYDLNEDIINANESELRLKEAWAVLGEELAPVAEWIRNVLAGSLEWLAEKVGDAMEALQELKGWWDKTSNSWQELKGGGVNGLWERLTTIPGQEAKAASVTAGLTGAELREQGLRAADIVSAQQAASRTATSATDAMASRGSFSATITLATEDGRNLGQFVTPFVNEENAANPPVRSDPL